MWCGGQLFINKRMREEATALINDEWNSSSRVGSPCVVGKKKSRPVVNNGGVELICIAEPDEVMSCVAYRLHNSCVWQDLG